MFPLTQKDKQFLLLLGALLTLYILPIILADFYYADDVDRIFRKNINYGWDENGRLFSIFIYWVLNFGMRLFDTSPFTQIMAGFLIYKRFLQKSSIFLASLIIFLFIANPFFIQNLSYKYDSIFMGLGFFTSVSAFYIYTSKNKYSSIYSIMLLTISLLMYQPVITVFIGLSIINYILGQDNLLEKKRFISLIKATLIFLISFIVYYIITKPFIAGYILKHNSIISFNKEGIYQLFLNIYCSFVYINLFFKDKITIILFIFSFITSYFLISFSILKEKSCNNYVLIKKIIIIFFPIILMLVILLPILPLANGVIHARIFTGFSLIFLFTFIGLIKIKYLKYLLIFPVLYCLVFSYTYSNTQKRQKEFDLQIANYIVFNLDNLGVINSINNIFIKGYEPHAPENYNTLKKFPLIKSLTYRYMESWVKFYIKRFPIFNEKIKITKYDNEAEANIEKFKKSKPVKNNPIYSLKIVDDTVLIEYKEQKNQ